MLFKTMKKANIVLAIIEENIKDEITLYLYPYHNGRERGWQLVKDDKTVVFSEYRNTDQIVVYHGLINEFDNAIPSEKRYAEKTFFAYNNYNKAANFCIQFILS